jgi:hypothetical protein
MRLKQKETHRKEEQLYFPQPCNVDLFVARKSGVPAKLPAPGLSEISILMGMRWTLEIGASSRMPDRVVDLCSDDLRLWNKTGCVPQPHQISMATRMKLYSKNTKK